MTDPKAEKRALELLPRVLNPRERAHFERTGRILITGSAGGQYEIRRDGYVGNVITRQGVPVGRYPALARAGTGLCAHPSMVVFCSNGINRERLPQTDAHIAQILAIKADEMNFLRTANVYGWFGVDL